MNVKQFPGFQKLVSIENHLKKVGKVQNVDPIIHALVWMVLGFWLFEKPQVQFWMLFCHVSSLRDIAPQCVKRVVCYITVFAFFPRKMNYVSIYFFSFFPNPAPFLPFSVYLIINEYRSLRRNILLGKVVTNFFKILALWDKFHRWIGYLILFSLEMLPLFI